MLERRPEPELMDDTAQAAAYAGADFDAAHGAIIDALATRLGTLGGRVLELGCGPADIAVRLVRAYPGCVVDGIDGAQAMLAEGHRRLAGEGLEGSIRLHRVNLPAEPLPRRDYDAVISNSLLHHLHDPAVLWAAIRAAAAPGAAVFIADLARPATEAEVEGLVAGMADEPEVLRRDFRASLHAAFTPDEVRARVADAGLPLRVEQIDDHHLIAWGWMATA